MCAYCDGSVEHFNSLEELGFQFERSYCPAKAVIQPNAEGLMYTKDYKGLTVLRDGGAAEAQGASNGDRPATSTDCKPGCTDVLRKTGVIRVYCGRCGPKGPRERRYVEAVRGVRCGQGEGRPHRRWGI